MIKRTGLTALLVSVLVFNSTTFAFIPNQDRCIDLKAVVAVYPLSSPIFTKEMITKYVPTNLTPTTDSNALASQMEAGVGQRLGDMLMNEYFKKTSLGQMTTKIEKAAQQSVSLGNTEGGVTHKINFNVKAVERMAQVVYEGYFKSRLGYVGSSNNMELVVSKDLAKNTVLSFTNTAPMGTTAVSSMLQISHTF